MKSTANSLTSKYSQFSKKMNHEYFSQIIAYLKDIQRKRNMAEYKNKKKFTKLCCMEPVPILL